MASTALHTAICDRFGVDYPIFGFSHSADVVIAICRAGGIGVWGGTRNTPEEIEENLTLISSGVDGRPFGVDLVIPAGMPERNNREEIEELLPNEHIAFVDGLWKSTACRATASRGHVRASCDRKSRRVVRSTSCWTRMSRSSRSAWAARWT